MSKDVMNKNEETKERFLETLMEVRTITKACALLGISRGTIYDWENKDREFKLNVVAAKWHARETMCEIAEDVLMVALMNNDIGTAKYVLKHHHRDYADKPIAMNSRPKTKTEVFTEEKMDLKKGEEMCEDIFRLMFKDKCGIEYSDNLEIHTKEQTEPTNSV